MLRTIMYLQFGKGKKNQELKLHVIFSVLASCRDAHGAAPCIAGCLTEPRALIQQEEPTASIPAANSDSNHSSKQHSSKNVCFSKTKKAFRTKCSIFKCLLETLYCVIPTQRFRNYVHVLKALKHPFSFSVTPFSRCSPSVLLEYHV